MNITLVVRKVEDLIPYENNARTHSEAQVAQIAASIKEFGFTNPILINEANIIIAGEGRAMAAMKLKLETVPCIVLSGLTEAQWVAYVIADNKIALGAGWDTDLLLEELGRISDLELDVNFTGFCEIEVMALLDHVKGELAEVSGVAPTTNADGSLDWSGMPEFNQPRNKPFRSIVMHFNDQTSVDAFAKRLEKNVTDRTKYLWYPEHIKNDNTGVSYE